MKIYHNHNGFRTSGKMTQLLREAIILYGSLIPKFRPISANDFAVLIEETYPGSRGNVITEHLRSLDACNQQYEADLKETA